MAVVTAEYVKNLPPIYRDVLRAFWMFNPLKRPNYGVSFQTLYSVLRDKHTLGQIQEACIEMAKGGAMEIRNEIFAHPTPAGDELIALLNSDRPSDLPAFPPLQVK